MIYPKIQKHLPQSQQRHKFKKQCLKTKNILFQNEQLQLGCKISPLYDLYSSTNHLQINLFIGNKTDKTLDSFTIDFRSTPNLQVYLQQKTRSIKERTQYKERIIINCNNYQQQILILIDFQSPYATLKSTPLPITLYNFCIFNKTQTLPPNLQNQQDLITLLQHKYQYNEQQTIKVTSPLFKKDIITEIQKYFNQLHKICNGVYIGHFTTKTLIDQYTITIALLQQNTIKISLNSNQYQLFDQLFANLKFLLE